MGSIRVTDSGGTGGDADSDSDGLKDSVETLIGTDPQNSDTDGDGVSDGAEVTAGTDPRDPTSTPTSTTSTTTTTSTTSTVPTSTSSTAPTSSTTTTTAAPATRISLFDVSTLGPGARWRPVAQVVALDASSGGAVQGARVTVEAHQRSTSIGTRSCTTDATGTCVVSWNGLKLYDPVTATVTAVVSSPPWDGVQTQATLRPPS